MASSALSAWSIARAAKAASPLLSLCSRQQKNKALRHMAGELLKSRRFLLKENAKDVAAARKRRLSSSLVARLALDEEKLKEIAASLLTIAALPDPVGQVIATLRRPNGLLIRKVRVPLGVILIIYESRPNVTADCMGLCLKSGNGVILKGGSEAVHSNKAIFEVLNRAAIASGIPPGAFSLVGGDQRSVVRELLQLRGQIDLVIPRGGERLIQEISRLSKIPVIKHDKGVCHVFVDKSADFQKAQDIVLNAKVQNPAVCNAMETLLVHRAVAKKFLPVICRKLSERGVELRGDDRTRRTAPGLKKATQKDWTTEYLDLILSIRVVGDLQQAVDHIRRYGSNHSDAIVTEDPKAARAFTQGVDSACVFVNCSTRFSDGGEFGMGAEMGISTDKLHARGPMGLEELTSYKYVVWGNGQVRQ